ncbi:hypothetical protein HAX54_041169 [Datura stramonium]|uniref:Uncharacterized protein n=1 Tax=Datura stramonium TaxID=4076 RepID=A0ABS8SL48_DATST|nr:hypothetical protein [Datura stramonium]
MGGARASSEDAESQARILRGLRLAARLKLSFTKEIEDAMRELSSSIMSLSKDNDGTKLYLMSYGAAGAFSFFTSEIQYPQGVLPFHGAYLSQQASKEVGKSSVMLMEAVKFAEKHSEDAAVYGPEFSDSQGSISDDELAKKVAQLAVQVEICNILTDRDSLLDAMSMFPGNPCSGLVDVISQNRKNIYRIDYDSLGKGDMNETGTLLGKVILVTVVLQSADVKVIKRKTYPLRVSGQHKEDASHENFHESLELMNPKFVSEDDNELNENNELQHDIFEEEKLTQRGCSELLIF